MLGFMKRKIQKTENTVDVLREKYHTLEHDLAEAKTRVKECSRLEDEAFTAVQENRPILKKVPATFQGKAIMREVWASNSDENHRVLNQARAKNREACEIVRKLERSISELKTELGQAERIAAREEKKSELANVDREVSEVILRRENAEQRLSDLREKLAAQKLEAETLGVELAVAEQNFEASERDATLSSRPLPKIGSDLSRLRASHHDMKKRIALLSKEIQSVSNELDGAKEAEKLAVLRRCELSRLNIEDSYGAAELVLQSAVDAFRDEASSLIDEYETIKRVAKKLGVDLRSPIPYIHDRGRIELQVQIGNTKVKLLTESNTKPETSTHESVAVESLTN
jgi:chromosome segregation ATPase